MALGTTSTLLCSVFIVISPHSDDGEIGGGAFIRYLLEKGIHVENWVITGSKEQSVNRRRKAEAVEAANTLSEGTRGKMVVKFLGVHKSELTQEHLKD